MKLYANPTSPFVRIVRMALIEKGLDGDVETVSVDAWGDDPAFFDANPAGRVPTLVTDDGARLTEALLILHHLDAIRPTPPVLTGTALACAGIAVGVFDAAVAIVIGRKVSPNFDTGLVGTKRFRTLHDGLRRVDATLPADGPFDIAPMAAITALDYLQLRFPDRDWGSLAPKLAARRDAEGQRRSVRETAPTP